MGTRRRRVSVMRSRSKPVKWDHLRMELISNCTADTISKAARALIDGYLVAFPTETVYGLGADATNEKAVSRIYSVKGRPSDHPLIVHISSINKLQVWATDVPDYAIKLAREFWPGPMTLVLPRTDIAKDFITGGQNNVGLRIPDQPLAIEILKTFEEMGGHGVAAPSANRFSAVSATSARDVIQELGDRFENNDLIVDGGLCLVGIESTIVDCTGLYPKILRPGAITRYMIEKLLNLEVLATDLKSITRSPGMLRKHYSPKAKIYINLQPEPGDGLIALSEVSTPIGVIRLLDANNVDEYARRLYSAFRRADLQNISRISVFIPEGDGMTYALFDRISKAAATSSNFVNE